MQASEAAAATASKSLLESLDDSDDDFGGPPPYLSTASAVSQPAPPDGGRDTVAWRVQLMAAEAPYMAASEHSVAGPRPVAQPMCIDSEQLYRHNQDTEHDTSTLHSQTLVDNVLRTTHVLSALRSLPLQTASS